MREQYGSDRTTHQLSLALGWFSIALGVAELAAPRQLARLIGVEPRERATSILRAYGAREIASGIGILSQPDEAKWLWSRVGGDAIDLASLGQAAAREHTDGGRLSFAAAAVMGVTVLDILCARRLSASDGQFDGFESQLGDEQAVTVRAPLEEVESAWINWCASGHARLQNNYAVRFEPAPGARGTEVHLSGGGSKGTIREELRRFKQLLETGEIVLSESPSLRRPAQPPRDADDVKTIAEVL
jgi:uncharacterized membrane protein